MLYTVDEKPDSATPSGFPPASRSLSPEFHPLALEPDPAFLARPRHDGASDSAFQLDRADWPPCVCPC